MLPKRIKIVEVGPRDGLQNEQKIIETTVKAKLIDLLSSSGLSCIEAGSFVSNKYVAQMHNTKEVLSSIRRASNNNVNYSVLVPNDIGMQAVIDLEPEYRPDSIAVFTSASESFCQKNINCSISESIARFSSVIKTANEFNIPVRGYVSCVLGCPYEGDIKSDKVAELAKLLIDMGCYEISLGDTIGIGTIYKVNSILDAMQNYISIDKLAVHFHDTYGQALVNVYAALQRGVSVVDSAVAGLGGCPYAKGASGNLATEDLLYMLNGLGIETGVDIDKIIKAGQYITSQLDILPRSKIALVKMGKF